MHARGTADTRIQRDDNDNDSIPVLEIPVTFSCRSFHKIHKVAAKLENTQVSSGAAAGAGATATTTPAPVRPTPSSNAPGTGPKPPPAKGNRMSLLLKTFTSEAIMCRLPTSLAKPADIDLQKCREQFDTLVNVLREIGVDVVELPPDDTSPSSSYVGDVAFVLNGMGLIMRPKGRADGQDIQTMRTLLRKELEIPVVEVDDKNAYVEGADILFTGRELFIGLSNFTNEAGAAFVAKTFPEYPCSPIKLPGPFHLSHYVNMVCEDVICVGSGKESQEVIKRMEREANFRSYLTLTVPDDVAAAALLFVNGTLIHCTAEMAPISHTLFADRLPRRRAVDLSELVKVGNFSLRRFVVLLNKIRNAK